jgi:hypothetical protein
VFSRDQVDAVRAAFSLAGYDGELRVLPVESEDERIFVVNPDHFVLMGDAHLLEQVLASVLGRSVLVTDDVGARSVAFD